MLSSKLFFRLFLLLLLSITIPKLKAELVFDQNPIELKPEPADEVVEAKFTFRNGGDKPITIVGLDSACSCLEATLDKATYQPGEKGYGIARFKVSTFVGRHEKTLHITTDDPKQPEQVLTSVIDIPVIVQIEPKTLKWTLGEPAVAKTYHITINGPDPVHLKNINATRDIVSFNLEEVTPGRHYKIHLQPKNTDNITIGALRIETDSKYPRHVRQLAFFNIVRPDN